MKVFELRIKCFEKKLPLFAEKILDNKKYSDKLGSRKMSMSRTERKLRVSQYTDELMSVFSNPEFLFVAENQVTMQSIKALKKLLTDLEKELEQ